jgi:hypothetical protein
MARRQQKAPRTAKAITRKNKLAQTNLSLGTKHLLSKIFGQDSQRYIQKNTQFLHIALSSAIFQSMKFLL